jgi:hypothetical protein
MVRGFNPGRGKRFSVLQNFPDQLWGPPKLQFNGYQGSFLGVKWPGCEVDHSPPSSAEVKNECNYTSAPPICLHGVGRTTLLVPLL